jgi:nucleoside-diphosphate-sugar epimerase
VADLDRLPEGVNSLPHAGLLLHAAPPGPEGDTDTRTRALLAALDARDAYPRRVVYIGTSGVYGDCGGGEVDESWPLRPKTARARRRADAEAVLTEWCAKRKIALVILRAPGIYGGGRWPVERVRAGTPVLAHADDVYTNHIHAEDLAGICVRALEENAPPGVYNASDDSEMLMGDWMDAVADHFGLARPPRIPRGEAADKIPAGLLSFLGESRRLINTKLKSYLGYRLQYPTVMEGLAAEPSDVSSFTRRDAAASRGQSGSPGAGKSTGAGAPGLQK